jgi:hypothetical protein
MQLRVGTHKSHNMKETNSYKCLWIDGWLDCDQDHKKCGIVKKDDVQTPNDKRDKEMLSFAQFHVLINLFSNLVFLH